MNINHSVFYSYVDVHSFGSNTILFTEHIIKAGWLSLIEKGWCLVMIPFAWLIIMDNFYLFVVIFASPFEVSISLKWWISAGSDLNLEWSLHLQTPTTIPSTEHQTPPRKTCIKDRKASNENYHLLDLVIMISLTVTNIELWV